MKDINYRFSPNVSPKTISRVKQIDKLLDFILPKPVQAPVIPIKTIAITQLAHIGDLILMLPALKKIKMLGNYHINLVVSSQNYLIASKLTFIDSVSVVDAPYFARGKKVSYFKFISQLRKIKADLVFDCRGDLRNNIFIKLFTKKKIFAGYNVGGGDAVLDVVLPYGHNKHITGLLDPLFDFLSLPEVDLSSCWSPNNIPYEEIKGHVFPDEFIVVHLGAGAKSRQWGVKNFTETIKAVSDFIPVYVLGINADASEEEIEELASIPNVTVCIGKYSILQSMYILKHCSLFLGLDSGFSHIAAMFKKKVIVLFSGAANQDVWKPFNFYNNQVTVVKRPVPCDFITGCGKLVCADNICMKEIYPIEVIKLLQEHLENKISSF
ncbi:glycosyltransferase family 9 protein [Mucilaginibacter phyllosphaerae]